MSIAVTWENLPRPCWAKKHDEKLWYWSTELRDLDSVPGVLYFFEHEDSKSSEGRFEPVYRCGSDGSEGVRVLEFQEKLPSPLPDKIRPEWMTRGDWASLAMLVISVLGVTLTLILGFSGHTDFTAGSR